MIGRGERDDYIRIFRARVSRDFEGTKENYHVYSIVHGGLLLLIGRALWNTF